MVAADVRHGVCVAVIPVIGLFVSLVWALIIMGIAVVEDVMRRLPFGSAGF